MKKTELVYKKKIVLNTNESMDLVIAESNPSDGRLDHRRIRIPIENARGLRDALNKSIKQIDKINRMKFISRSSILDNMRDKEMKGNQSAQVEKTSNIAPSNELQLKESHIHKQRKIYPKAYMPWTAEDDSKLEDLYCEGCSVRILAQVFERNMGAITSRIKKLELRDKYN